MGKFSVSWQQIRWNKCVLRQDRVGQMCKSFELGGSAGKKHRDSEQRDPRGLSRSQGGSPCLTGCFVKARRNPVSLCVEGVWLGVWNCFLPSLGELGSHAMYPHTFKSHNRITPGGVSAVLLCSIRGNHQLFVQSLSYFLLSFCLPGSLPLTLFHNASVTSQLSQCAFLFKLKEKGKLEKGKALQFSTGQDSFSPPVLPNFYLEKKRKKKKKNTTKLTWLRL